MENVRDVVQFARGMPVLGKKIPPQHLNVFGESHIWRSEPAQRAANPPFGSIVIIGPHQTNYFSVKRGLEEIGKKSAAEETGNAGQENSWSAPPASTQKTIYQVGTPWLYFGTALWISRLF